MILPAPALRTGRKCFPSTVNIPDADGNLRKRQNGNHDAFRRLRNGKGHLHPRAIRRLRLLLPVRPIVTLAEVGRWRKYYE